MCLVSVSRFSPKTVTRGTVFISPLLGKMFTESRSKGGKCREYPFWRPKAPTGLRSSYFSTFWGQNHQNPTFAPKSTFERKFNFWAQITLSRKIQLVAQNQKTYDFDRKYLSKTLCIVSVSGLGAKTVTLGIFSLFPAFSENMKSRAKW